MRIIGIISSPRLNGNTATLVREALKGGGCRRGGSPGNFSGELQHQILHSLLCLYEQRAMSVNRRF